MNAIQTDIVAYLMQKAKWARESAEGYRKLDDKYGAAYFFGKEVAYGEAIDEISRRS